MRCKIIKELKGRLKISKEEKILKVLNSWPWRNLEKI